MTTKLRSLVGKKIDEADKSRVMACRELRISRKTLWTWQRDVGRARLGDLARLADYLGCEVEDLYEKIDQR